MNCSAIFVSLCYLKFWGISLKPWSMVLWFHVPRIVISSSPLYFYFGKWLHQGIIGIWQSTHIFIVQTDEFLINAYTSETITPSRAWTYPSSSKVSLCPLCISFLPLLPTSLPPSRCWSASCQCSLVCIS